MLSENSASDFDDSYSSQAQDNGLDDREDSKDRVFNLVKNIELQNLYTVIIYRNSPPTLNYSKIWIIMTFTSGTAPPLKIDYYPCILGIWISKEKTKLKGTIFEFFYTCSIIKNYRQGNPPPQIKRHFRF